GVRADLVGKHDADHVLLVKPAKFDLEVDQLDAAAEEQTEQEIVDPQGQRDDVVEILRRCPAKGGDVLLGHQRVGESGVLVEELHDGAWQLRAFLEAEALGERSRRDVPNDHLGRDDLDLADQLLAHVDAADEMGRYADLAELGHQEFGDAVVDNTLAGDRALLLIVERGGIVLEVLDDGPGLRPLEQGFGLALVDAAAAGHCLLLDGRLALPTIGPEYGGTPM